MNPRVNILILVLYFLIGFATASPDDDTVSSCDCDSATLPPPQSTDTLGNCDDCPCDSTSEPQNTYSCDCTASSPTAYTLCTQTDLSGYIIAIIVLASVLGVVIILFIIALVVMIRRMGSTAVNKRGKMNLPLDRYEHLQSVHQPRSSYTGLSNQGADTPSEETRMSRQGANMSRQGADMSRQGDDASRQGDNMSRQGAETSRQGPILTRQNTEQVYDYITADSVARLSTFGAPAGKQYENTHDKDGYLITHSAL